VNSKATRVRLQRNSGGACRFALDTEVFSQDASRELSLSGWAVHPDYRIAKVVLGCEESSLAAVEPDIHRPRVSTLHADFPGADRAGFRMTLKTLPVGEYWLKVEGEHGQSERIGQLRLVLADQPRLVFMHIAKAAGSTVNAYLASHYAKGSFLLHLESEKAWRSDPASLQKYDLLSGHVGLHSLQRRLGLSQYRLVTVVREPYAQLYSHLAWIRRLSDPGEELRLSRHPDYIKTFSRKLADCDFSHPADLRRLIASLDDAERQLVDNCQVRYFARVEAGARVDAGSLAAALAGVRQFDRIGLAAHRAL